MRASNSISHVPEHEFCAFCATSPLLNDMLDDIRVDQHRPDAGRYTKLERNWIRKRSNHLNFIYTGNRLQSILRPAPPINIPPLIPTTHDLPPNRLSLMVTKAYHTSSSPIG
jgi:hypothetical protein